jgi:hypothetical protein
MLRLLQYYGRFQTARGALGGLPVWARWIVFLCALPGIALLLLSIAAFFVSLFALLLLTVPVYRLLSWTADDGAVEKELNAPLGGVDFVEPVDFSAADKSQESPAATGTVELRPVSPQPRRQIEVRIVEP